MYQTIISVNELIQLKNRDSCLLIDCRYDLADSSSGLSAYLESHIVGAIYADLRNDLCGEPLTCRGRHPLPAAEKLRKVFSRFGIKRGTQVVVYDASFGSFAARLWWLLRYMGHDAVAVLDGGWQTWQSALQPVETGERKGSPTLFQGEPRKEWLVVIDEVADSALLVDSRDEQRYLGAIEPIDPVAGHIPGAINRCWTSNLTEEGYFLDSWQLQQQFNLIYGEIPGTEVVFYCGSGVTACHNLLAVHHSGLPAAKLYAGSWSEWCQEADRPIETGQRQLLV